MSEYYKIKSLLALKGIKSTDIAVSAGCSQGAVSQVISGKRTSARIRRAVAAKLKMPVSELWPDGK